MTHAATKKHAQTRRRRRRGASLLVTSTTPRRQALVAHEWDYLAETLTLNDGASEDLVQAAASALPFPFPEDYLSFCRYSNGAEGQLGAGYVQFWPIQSLAELNEAYSVSEFNADLLLIGTDGGNEAYALRKHSDARITFASVPLIGMAPGQAADLGNTFTELLAAIATLHEPTHNPSIWPATRPGQPCAENDQSGA